MTERLTDNHSERHASDAQNKPRGRFSWAVAPLLFVCSLALSGFMFMQYSEIDASLQVPDTPHEESQSNGTDVPSVEEEEEVIEEPEERAVIGQYRAVSASEEAGRVENIRLAAEAINGTVIAPGESFSFNAAVGDIGNDERYQIAPIISSDGMVYGRGGGSCQVSSALYLAALYTDLRIVERHPHSAVVDYVPIGLDATVVYGYMDLVLANDSENPVTIEAEAEGQTVTVRILGTPLEEGKKVEPVSTLIEYHEAGTPVANAVEWDPVLENTTFYIVESYREYYYEGSKVETILLARDRYMVFADDTIRMPDGNGDATK